MNHWRLTYRNLIHYARYYRLIALATVIAVAVIVGSLLIGDSVRTTLINRVNERLGDTETVLFTSYSFLDETILDKPVLSDPDAKGILFVEGFVSEGTRLLPVTIWGIDHDSIREGQLKMNESLSQELSRNLGEDVALRLPSSGLIPSGSLFVTKNYTTSLRLTHAGIMPISEGGNLSLKSDQTLPFNIFVNRKELAHTLGLDGKVNVILFNQKIDEKDIASIWEPQYSGLKVQPYADGITLLSDQVFIPERVVEAISRPENAPNRLFSYLANAITSKNGAIPYSFVTALDTFAGNKLETNEAILSDYSAHRLGISVGDSIDLTYFVSSDFKVLNEEKRRYIVRAILPLRTFVEDSLLSADFPGLSDVVRCTDWDSDLPINMNLITEEDEAYWERYRSTPKILISYESIKDSWQNAYGSATALRFEKAVDLSRLSPSMLGVNLLYPRETGLYAATNSVDFSELFLALGFFIIASALLLMLAPLSEMFYQRRSEWQLMNALGFPAKRMSAMLWKEVTPILLIATLIGIGFAIVYTYLILELLGGAWSGITRTQGFSLTIQGKVLIVGLVASLLILGSLLGYLIFSAFRSGNRLREKKNWSSKTWCRLAIGATFMLLLVWIVAWHYWSTVISFILVGVLSLVAAYIWGNFLLIIQREKRKKVFNAAAMRWVTLFARRKEVRISFLTLALGVFTVFSVGLNRQGFGDSTQLGSGTGGFSLWCETQVPIYYSLTTQEGRHRLSLDDLPDDALLLQGLRYKAEEASCLNLNKVTQPSMVGMDFDALANSGFRIKESLFGKENGWKAFQSPKDDLYPALVDETVLIWNLGMELGDTLSYQIEPGRNVRILLAGILENSVFQGQILIDQDLFKSIWPKLTGSDLFLVKTRADEIDDTRTLLSQALSEYGIRVTTTSERLAQFYEVTDTYLTIFMVLGSLGLLVGLFCLVVTIRKELLMRQTEIQLYFTQGFPEKTIRTILVRENRLVPYYAIVMGVICAMIGTGRNIAHVSWSIWVFLILVVAFFLGCVWGLVNRVTIREINSALRRKAK